MLSICAIASTYGVPVIPHHGGVASTHLIAAHPQDLCPLQEWLLQHVGRANVLLEHKAEPVGGFFELSDTPGLGTDLDESALESLDKLAF
jgi:L-alanine-DL-glutamate epimerase-like enolase superfamily enzyme